MLISIAFLFMCMKIPADLFNFSLLHDSYYKWYADSQYRNRQRPYAKTTPPAQRDRDRFNQEHGEDNHTDVF